MIFPLDILKRNVHNDKLKTEEIQSISHILQRAFMGYALTFFRAILEEKMSIDRVKKYFSKYGMEEKIIEFDVSSATVELAARALGCEPGRIAKTLSFLVEDAPILIVSAGDVKIDNAKYKKTFGKKAKMLTKEQVTELIGHAVGGVCPFAVNEGVTVYLDESLKKYDTVFPACGSSNSAIELTCEQLEKYSGYREWVDVCKAIQ